MTKLLGALVKARVPMVTSAAVLAQVWRGGAGAQVPISLLLPQVEIAPLHASEAKLIGLMLGVTGTRDAVDGHIVLLAQARRWPVLTSDPKDLRAFDAALEVLLV